MNLHHLTGLAPQSASAVRLTALVALASLAAACQSSPVAHSGFLTSYDGLGDPQKLEKGVGKRRDAALSEPIKRVYIEPSVLKVDPAVRIAAKDQAMVQNEVDRQVCFEVSRHFDLVPAPAADAGTVRTAIVRIETTNRVGSAATAAAEFFNPIPMPLIAVRIPMTTGGLAAESELLDPTGRQAAAITWSKSAEVVGTTDASLSPVGDALQLAEPFGDAVGKAFSAEAKKKRLSLKRDKGETRKIASPDPCARFGPRRNASRFVGGILVGATTGLYSPTISGAGRPAKPEPSSAARPPAIVAAR